MKKALLTALLALIITPLFAGGAYAETLSEKAAGATGATAAEQALPESVRGISGRIEADGQYDAPGALEAAVAENARYGGAGDKGNLQSASALAAIALRCTALASSLSPGGTAQGYISIAGVGAAAALLVGSVDSLAVQTVSALGLMSDYSRAALPAVFTAAAACGAVVSASARYAAVCIAIDVLMAAAQKFVIPLVYAYIALALCGALFENPLLKTCQRFSKWLATTFMTAFTIAFSGYIRADWHRYERRGRRRRQDRAHGDIHDSAGRRRDNIRRRVHGPQCGVDDKKLRRGAQSRRCVRALR